MKIYQCIVDGKQVGNLQFNFNIAKKFLVDYMWYNSHIPRAEVSVWVTNIMDKVLPFDITLGCGIKVSVKGLNVNSRILSTEETSEIADRIVKSYFVHRCDTDEHGFCCNLYKYNSERIIRNISHKYAVSIKRKLQHRINKYNFLFYSVPCATLYYEKDTNTAYFDFTYHLFNCSLEMVRLLTK